MSLTLTALLLAAPFQSPEAVIQEAFPVSTPLEEGLSPKAIAGLSDLVQGFVDDGDIVGAELLIIKNGKTVMHGAYGHRDVEEDVAMAPGGVFCVRSMTKPLVGVAIGMLLEERAIRLKDPVSKYLPYFDAETTKAITIEQLLQHTSGLPMSYIMAKNPRELTSIGAVAELGGGSQLEFAPGTAFNYSDQGTDTLTALIEVVTGAPPQDFVQSRILTPLGMGDSACLMTEGHALRSRTCSAYMGQPGTWSRFWGPKDEALFPVFLGSQGLYSTAVDYAKFLQFLMRKGRAIDGRILRGTSVKRILEPGPFPLGSSTGLPGLQADYGSLMQLWTADPKEGKDQRRVVAFGHTGSDGTHGWAFPKEKAIVLYFTQSRGTMTGIQVEEHLGALLLGKPFDPIEAAPPLEEFVGYYCEDKPNDRYRSIIHHEGGLALEILGKAVVPLVYAGGDRWKLKPQPGTVLEFDRGDDGHVTGYHIGDHEEFRFEPAADLPSIDEVIERVIATHQVEKLQNLGVLRVESSLSIEKLGIEGTRSSWSTWPDLWRVDESVSGESVSTAHDGKSVRQKTGDKETETLEGMAARLALEGTLRRRFGDWRTQGLNPRVIQRIEKGDENVLMVRLGDTSGMAPTVYIDTDRWVVGRIDSMTFIPGMGLLGQEVEFGDFRELEGMLIPYGVKIELANRMIGTIEVHVTEAAVGEEIAEGWFRIED